jgi:hypothetical protein
MGCKQLRPEGKRFTNVPAFFSPFQVQCITKNRLFTAPIRNQMERIQYSLDRYSHIPSKWLAVADALEPDSPRTWRIDAGLVNTNVINKHIGTSYMYSLRVQPVIFPTPIAKVRFREQQVGPEYWDFNFIGKLALGKLPTPKRRRLFVLKTRTSCTKKSDNPATTFRIEPLVWAEFARSFGHLASTTHEIRRTELPNPKIQNQLVHVLQETDFWLHKHANAEASRPWLEATSTALKLLELLQSFGTVDVHIITTNIENITSTLSLVLPL